MEKGQDKELRKLQRNKIRTAIILLLIALAFGGVVFTYFHITTEARMALRSGKNAKLALDMLDVEYYGLKKSVYDPARRDGLAVGVEEQVYRIVEQSGKVAIADYDEIEHKIRYMIYEEENYRVIYQYDAAKGDCWRVDYLVTIFDYSQ